VTSDNPPLKARVESIVTMAYQIIAPLDTSSLDTRAGAFSLTNKIRRGAIKVKSEDTRRSASPETK
jgi:hypothetical protein